MSLGYIRYMHEYLCVCVCGCVCINVCMPMYMYLYVHPCVCMCVYPHTQIRAMASVVAIDEQDGVSGVDEVAAPWALWHVLLLAVTGESEAVLYWPGKLGTWRALGAFGSRSPLLTLDT
jgi:hypothetical protein